MKQMMKFHLFWIISLNFDTFIFPRVLTGYCLFLQLFRKSIRALKDSLLDQFRLK